MLKQASLLIFLLLVLFSPSLSRADPTQPIFETLQNQTRFSNLVSNLEHCPLIKDLLANSTVKLTLFAPVDAKSEYNISCNVLLYHLVVGAVTSHNVTNGELIPTALLLGSLGHNAQRVKITKTVNKDNSTDLEVNQRQVVDKDLLAENGVIHAISDALVLPDVLPSSVEADKDLKTFKALLEKTDALNSSSLTLFAPTDAAFAELKETNPALYGYLFEAIPVHNETLEIEEDIKMFVDYHVVSAGSTIYSADIKVGTTLEDTLNKEKLALTKSINNTVTVGDEHVGIAEVLAVDNLASNGVYHTINKVLVPSTFEFTLNKILAGFGDSTFVDLLKRANMTDLLNDNEVFTLFVPTDTAFSVATTDYLSSDASVASLLSSHIHVGPIESLEWNGTYTMLNNRTLEVVHPTHNTTALALKGSSGTAYIIGNPVGSEQWGYVYSIDRVLGVGIKSNDDSGLTKSQIGWIIVGCFGAVLLVGGLIVVVVVLIKRRKTSGYTEIGHDDGTINP